MFKLAKIFKDYNDSDSFNSQINLFGFVDDHTFLTKTGDIGVVLSVAGVDYECLDTTATDAMTKRFESALKLFDEKYRVYQYLQKSNHPPLPHRYYGIEPVDAATKARIEYLEKKSEHLYSLSVHYVILYEAYRYQNTFTAALKKLTKDARGALRDLVARLSQKETVYLMDKALGEARERLHMKVATFIHQLAESIRPELLDKDQAFLFLRSLVNLSPHKRQVRRQHDTFLDWHVCDSTLAVFRDHLELDEYSLKVYTLKEPTGQSWPLIFKGLVEMEANLLVCMEWQKEDNAKAKRHIQYRRRHFHNTKTSFMAQMQESKTGASDQLIDDAKAALVADLGQATVSLDMEGHSYGHFSLTALCYDRDPKKLSKVGAELYKIFSAQGAALFEERYNQLNAFLAIVPGNYAFNLRKMLLLNAWYADYSFLFTSSPGEISNPHLGSEYLAVVESNHHSPFYLNLHHADLAHTAVLGPPGMGKSFLVNFLLTFLQKYHPYTFIFDIQNSYERLTHIMGGTYLKVGAESQDFKINPFCLPASKETWDFLFTFIALLIEGEAKETLTHGEQQDLYEQIKNIYHLPPHVRTLSTLKNTLGERLRRALHRWTRGGQYGQLFDNEEDTLTFSRWQCFEFQEMDKHTAMIEPLLFYVLERASAVINEPRELARYKQFVMDECWKFITNPRLESYILEALKTWRKKNAGMLLATQSVNELVGSRILNAVQEACPTKIFAANPEMNTTLYQDTFRLTDKELDVIRNLLPKQQFLLRQGTRSRIFNLNVDAKSYFIYTSDPQDNVRVQKAIAQLGFVQGLEYLANQNGATV